MYMMELFPRQGGTGQAGIAPGGAPPGFANSPFAAPAPPNASHYNQRVNLIIPSVLLLVVMLVCIAARIYSRVRILKFLGLDDYVLMAAATAACVMAVVNCVGTKYGLGTHIWDVKKKDVPIMRQLIYFNTIAFHIGVNLCKISLLIFIHRLTGVSWKMRLITLAILAAVIIYTIAFLFVIAFQCHPVHAYWVQALQKPGACLPSYYLFVAGGVNLATDLVILILPMPVLYKLKLPPRQKMGVLLVFALGGLVCVASIFRIFALRLTLIKKDPYEIRIHYATLIEMDVAIMCGSLPALKPLFQHHFPSVFGSLGSASSFHMPNSHPSHPRSVLTHSSISKSPGGGWDKMRDYELRETASERSDGSVSGKIGYGSESTEAFNRM